MSLPRWETSTRMRCSQLQPVRPKVQVEAATVRNSFQATGLLQLRRIAFLVC
jgi:hypothetical protein